MNKAVFLDRDGTINVEKHYLYRIEDFEFIDGSIDAMRMLQDAGYLLIIITNQSGIARGYYSEDDFLKLNGWMTKTLENKGVHISKVYYCPHHPDAVRTEYKAACNCRKPQTGLYEKAIEEFSLDIGSCYAIGDKIRDCSICRSTACKGYLIGNNEDSKIIKQAINHEIKGVQYAKDLLAAARGICII